jgi:archaetidylinositol phosphate synthase
MAPAREHRVHESLLAAAEKRLLIRIARRLPDRINSDHLTAVGALGTVGAGVCYASGPASDAAVLLAIAMLAVNWFGDSLDGTVARVRGHERPRYGFYVDHVLDAVGMLCVIGGLAAGGIMSVEPAAAFLIAYFLLNIEIALATHTLGTFRISYWRFGPTELRILLAAGTLQLLRSPWVTVGGSRLLLFDLGGWTGAALLLITLAVSAVGHARALYRLEPVPAGRQPVI